jgi:hypothetical protein
MARMVIKLKTNPKTNTTKEMQSYIVVSGCLGRMFRRKALAPTRVVTAGQAAMFVDEEIRRASLSLQRPEKLSSTTPELRSSNSLERSRRSEEFGGDLHLLNS